MVVHVVVGASVHSSIVWMDSPPIIVITSIGVRASVLAARIIRPRIVGARIIRPFVVVCVVVVVVGFGVVCLRFVFVGYDAASWPVAVAFHGHVSWHSSVLRCWCWQERRQTVFHVDDA